MSESIINRSIRLTRSTPARALILFARVLATALLAQAKSNVEVPPLLKPPVPVSHTLMPGEVPRIEVVFVLDTTGSMSGLINGAKQKIWSIVDQMANANVTPDIRLGLIGYRDRGDAYVTKRFDLSDDIDALYGHLQGFAAGGGGDGPESVNQALDEAVTRMSWSPDQSVYKVIFLVGDAPPHMDYQDDVPYPESVAEARARGIVINTVQCGNAIETARIWAGIAALSHGRFASISQDGAMVAIHTPMDDELGKLNVELSRTVIAYGGRAQREELRAKVERSRAATPSATASRLGYFAKKGGATNSGREDLVTAVGEGKVDLDAIAKDELPAEMRAMSEPEQQRFLDQKSKERNRIQSRITALSMDRDEYLASARRERLAEGEADSFDDNVLETLRNQAASKGIIY